ncbi:DNA/RNA non-specific endonuclease [Nocardiopsis suaedae]|uniref:DNA/RNA non-specific endonuclease n=1 Tax=Nocardiopsis suaedae TaxID=3018444 RepID=A0ABT4TMH4_9ACTN|nr:DNA/RNA non-specific endonuclease [Nocardiopsis suaedae]MDA2805899.1 DNA/RNA non-specific endonuclease [Nocardiopsis suaedae]
MEAPPTSGTSGSGTTTMQHMNLDPGTLIVPEAIPIPGTAPEVLSDAASGTGSAGAGIESAGQDIKSVWQALAGVYTAPESDRLLRAANPIADLGGEIGGMMAAAAGALQKFSEEADRLKGQLLELRGTAQEFVDGAGDDWNDDSDLVDENVNLKVQANRLVTSFQEAERECANAITGLFGGTTFVPVDGDAQEKDGVIEYGVTMDSALNEVPEYSAFVYSDTWQFLGGLTRGLSETAGPGMAMTLGATFLASTGYYHPENGWTMDHWEALGNRGEFYTDFAIEVGTKAGNSLGIGFEEGTLYPSRWGLDVMTTHYRDQAHEFFPWTELDDDPGHAVGVGLGNTGMAVAGAAAGRALSLGKVASVATGVGKKIPGVDVEHILGTRLQGRVQSLVPQLRSGTTPPTWGGQTQWENGSTSSSGSGPGSGQQPGAENISSSVNQLDNKVENSQPNGNQPQNPLPQGQGTADPQHKGTGAAHSTPDSADERSDRSVSDDRSHIGAPSPQTSVDRPFVATSESPKSSFNADDQERADVPSVEERQSPDPVFGDREELGRKTDDTVSVGDVERFEQYRRETGDIVQAMKYEAQDSKAQEAESSQVFEYDHEPSKVAADAHGVQAVDGGNGYNYSSAVNEGGAITGRGEPPYSSSASVSSAGSIPHSFHEPGDQGPNHSAFSDDEWEDDGVRQATGEVRLLGAQPDAEKFVSEQWEYVDEARTSARVDQYVSVSSTSESHLAPTARQAFGQMPLKTRLDPYTSFEVHDRRGRYRGTFITAAEGEIVEVHAPSGVKGKPWNPDLKNPLPNVKYVVDDTRIYITGDNGIPVYTTDVGGLERINNDRGPEQSKIGNEGEGEFEELNRKILSDFEEEHGRRPVSGEVELYEIEEFDGGHLIATEWNGAGDRINQVSMRSSLNRILGGDANALNNYRKLEMHWEEIVEAEPGAKIIPHIFCEVGEKSFTDPARRARVPDRIYVMYEVEIKGEKRVGGPVLYVNTPPKVK